MMGNYIELADGSTFDFSLGRDTAPPIYVIAHALSQLARFTGHAKLLDSSVDAPGYPGVELLKVPYTVAQHCVKVSMLVPRDYAFVGLMHDAHEALIGDVATPLKRHLADIGVDYNEVDRFAYASIALRYGLPAPLPTEVKKADALMCLIEAIDLMPSRAKKWGGIFNALREEALELYITRPELRPEPWTANVSKDKFLARYVELTEAV